VVIAQEETKTIKKNKVVLVKEGQEQIINKGRR